MCDDCRAKYESDELFRAFYDDHLIRCEKYQKP